MNHLQGRYDQVHDRILDTNGARCGEEGPRYHSRSPYSANTWDFQHEHENTAVSKNSERECKSTALRWPCLITLLLALLITLALLIYAVASLPLVVESRDISEHLLGSQHQSSSLIHSADSRIHAYYINHRTPKQEIATHGSAPPISSTLFYPSPGSWRNVGDIAITESSTCFLILTSMPISNGGVTTTLDLSDRLTGPEEAKAFTDHADACPPTALQSMSPAYSRSSSDYARIGTRTVTILDTSTTVEIVTITVTPSLSAETGSLGNPTTTAIGYLSPSVHTAVYIIDGGHYFMGAFLPTLVASILAVAVAILDTNAKSFQSWHALTHERGASGRDSLCLETSGWSSPVMGLCSLVSGQAVIFLTSLLSLSSAVLIPVSANAVTLDLRGDGCEVGASSASNCVYVLSVSPIGSRASIGILAIVSLATMFLVIMVGRWRLGVYTNPWSMCALASLAVNSNVRQLILDATTGTDMKQAKSRLEHQEFKLDYFHSDKSTWSMGSGTLILVLYYAQTGGDTAFERFIDSDSFGVRILFSSLGVIINLFWSSFFSAVAIMTSYQVLAERPREACQSILLASPTNAFSGLWHATRTRRGFLGIVSLASIFSQSLSIFLSNVPFRVTQTFFVFQLSAWGAVGIMSFMVLITLSSFFVK
ncbi:hypothetical protein GGR58DRAFT_524655 [Xylaria digitata]|nr:hypothetical protein GGR58DRAFT_524655 [Xylaria digitata]